MRIGKRLEKVLSLIEKDLDCVIDIGTDHGFLALKVIEDLGAQKVYATDISEGSLNKAKELAKKYNVEDKMVCLLSNGFKDIPSNVSASLVVIAGIGGNETVKILTECENISRFKSFILQPMQDVEILREYLLKSGFNISYDETVKDRNKFYHIIKCKFSGEYIKYSLKDILIGKTDLKQRSQDFKEFLETEITSLKSREAYLNNEAQEKLKVFITKYKEVIK